MLILLYAALCAAQAPSNGLFAFAANALVQELVALNTLLLATLPIAERRGVDAGDQRAVDNAILKSPQRANPAWQKRFIAALNRGTRRNASPQAVSCQAPTATNGTFRAIDFLGPRLLLSGQVGVDLNCNGLLESNDFFFNAMNATVTAIVPIEIVQTTSDTRLKYIATFLPTVGDTIPQRQQPGMAHALLPAMTATTSDNDSSVTILTAAVSLPLYPEDGAVEAPITFIETSGTGCVADTSGTRFASQSIDVRFALTSIDADLDPETVANLTALGAIFGRCAPPGVRQGIAATQFQNYVGGAVFLDINNDGIRQPLEPTVRVPTSTSLQAAFTVAPGVLQYRLDPLPQLSNNVYLNLTTTVFFEEDAVGLFVNPGAASSDVYVDDAAVCGASAPQITISSTERDQNDVRNSFFVHNAQADRQTVNTTAGARTFIGAVRARVHDVSVNIGLACRRWIDGQTIISVVTECSADALLANQTTFVDRFHVTIVSTGGPNNAGAMPQLLRWLATSATRPLATSVVSSTDTYSVLPHTVDIAVEPAGVSSFSLATSQATYFATEVLDLAALGADQNMLEYTIDITTAYARGATRCAGAVGELVVAELVLNYVDTPFTLTIGSVGGLCSHTQPAECVGGGPATPSPTEAPIGTGTDQTFIVILGISVVALVIIIVLIAVGSR